MHAIELIISKLAQDHSQSMNTPLSDSYMLVIQKILWITKDFTSCIFLQRWMVGNISEGTISNLFGT